MPTDSHASGLTVQPPNQQVTQRFRQRNACHQFERGPLTVRIDLQKRILTRPREYEINGAKSKTKRLHQLYAQRVQAFRESQNRVRKIVDFGSTKVDPGLIEVRRLDPNGKKLVAD